MIELYNYIVNSGRLINLINDVKFRYYQEDIYQIWKENGFTLTCEYEDSVILSNIFEELSIFLNSNRLVVDDNIYVTVGDDIIFFAIARRLYDEYKVILSPLQLIATVKRMFPKITEEEKYFYYKEYNIDVDAEACVQVAKLIGRHFKK